MKEDKNQGKNKKLWIMFLILAVLFVFSSIIALFIGAEDTIVAHNTAIIPIKGPITIESDSGWFTDQSASSTDVIKMIEKAEDNPDLKAIIFEINSPGGSPVATDEISSKIKDLKQKNITTVAWVREVGASGAYWIASSTDYVIANRMSIVGSIGVFGSYIEWYGLMNKYNVTYKRLVSGEYKDTGVPYRPLTEREDIYLQSKLDKLHDHFIKAVSENRNMSYAQVKQFATGEIFLGSEAIDNGLIDELGSKEQALNYVESIIKEKPTTKEFAKEKSFLDTLMNTINKNSFYIGEGIGNGLVKDTGFRITT